jgi:4-hydroxybenzoate polyprenyltransferase
VSPPDPPPTASWSDPRYVSTVVGVVAVGVLYASVATVGWGPTVDEVTVVLLSVTLPATAAYALARRVESARGRHG